MQDKVGHSAFEMFQLIKSIEDSIKRFEFKFELIIRGILIQYVKKISSEQWAVNLDLNSNDEFSLFKIVCLIIIFLASKYERKNKNFNFEMN